jgi:hypothetical protein
MASTAEGRALTAAHRDAQIQVGARAEIEARALWDRLDVDDLDGSKPYWLASTTIAVNRRMAESQRVASEYLSEFRLAELGAAGAVILAAPKETARALSLAGPVRVKRLIGAGMDSADAFEAALTKFGGMVRRQAMMGGRLTVAATAGRDRRAVGWRRVTDGNPCAFCAMLASRGPVYRDAAAADGLQYHSHCGCTAEPAYSYAWEPTADEERYMDAYGEARAIVAPGGKAINTKKLLAQMRLQGGFRDSPTS